MTYNVFSGTLNPSHFTSLLAIIKFLESVTEWSRVVCEGEQFVVLELPLLFESGKMLRFIDTVIVVYWFVLLSYLVKKVPNASRDTVAMYLRCGGIFSMAALCNRAGHNIFVGHYIFALWFFHGRPM